MTWWQKLKSNPLAWFGGLVLLVFYLVAIGAELVAPYDPYESQVNGALLPPTQVYWRTQQGQWIGPHVYPTTQGPIDMQTGQRELVVDRQSPAPLRLFVQGSPYSILKLTLPIPKFQQVTLTPPPPAPGKPPSLPKQEWQLKFDEKELFKGFRGTFHLFGTAGAAKFNLLGTDDAARDQFSRLAYGSRISLSIGLVGIVISYPLGMLVGGISGFFGGVLDAVLMRLVEVIMTIPGIYLLVALAAVLPPGLSSAERFLLIVLITSFIAWAGLARVVRGQVLSIKERDFVQAARAMGGNPLYIILRHILPQTATYIIISATLTVPSFIVAESVLSLIGLGISQPDPSWGNMLSSATNASILVLQPWLVYAPALLIILTVLSFNLLGDGLRDALDPRDLRR